MSDPLYGSEILIKRKWYDTPTMAINRERYSAIRRFNAKVHSTYKIIGLGCAVCDSRDCTPLLDRDSYGISVCIGVCDKCGFVYNYRYLDDLSLNDFYRNEYRIIDRGSDAPTAIEDFFVHQYKKGQLIFLTLDAKIPDLKDYVVIEIGCGAGGILSAFKDRGIEVMGIDIGNLKYIEYGRSKGLNLSQGDLSSSKFPMGKKRLFIYEQVLEHVLDIDKEMLKLKGLMVASDRLYIGLPGLLNISRSYDDNIFQYFILPHIYYFTGDSLKALMSKYGFGALYCDETIRSIFVPDPQMKVHKLSQKQRIIDYLKECEARYRQRTKSSFYLRPFKRKCIGPILRTLGIF
ncbi:MAG: class I SAM-dependent methyltransferase [Oligoflexales bacterium]